MAGVSGVNGIYVVVDDYGRIFRVDGTAGSKTELNGRLEGLPPFCVACSSSHQGESETCIISDAAGRVWRGHPRGGDDFKLVD